MNKIDILKYLLEGEGNEDCHSTDTFLNVGTQYLIRTVTMIYTGKIKEIKGNEILLTEAAWIPETERWYDCLKDCKFKEVEPYPKDVILYKTSFLDVTEISSLPRGQK